MKVYNAKKEFNFLEDFTTNIFIFGQEKEVTYKNVIWLSKNKNWILYVTDCDSIMIEKVDEFICDIPIIYDNKEVAFDNPYRFPKYVKEKVTSILRKHY